MDHLEQSSRIRVAAIADIHYTKTSKGKLSSIFVEISATADILLLCGDLTDLGMASEGQVLIEDLRQYLTIPVIAVFGNHDFESNAENKLKKAFQENGMELLDGNSFHFGGINFVGVKGFAGGFGKHMLQSWGEITIKNFVKEAEREAEKLSQVLRQTSGPIIVLLHYSPIRDTLVGEHPEIFTYLGCSKLEDVLTPNVIAVFHGHAHNGTLSGKTKKGIPVFNVSAQLLEKHRVDNKIYRLLEFDSQKETG